MAHLDDSDATALSHSYDSDKSLLEVPVSPATSELPELLNAAIPIAEHDKLPRTRPREETPDRCRSSYLPVIPPKHSNRTLVLCFDGTGDQFDADNSNIVQLVSLLNKDDTSQQMVYYQAGIGTYETDGNPRSFASSIRKTLDEMVAWSIDAHIIEGYKFLMQNYTEGDKICLFGFSRGAYTARSLAGMLHKVGLLPPGNFQQVPFAYKMYTSMRPNKHGWCPSNEFKSAFSSSKHVPIEFIGVWDTVSSLGAIGGRSLPVTTASTNVRIFRHALSLDERRARFQPQFWEEKQIDIVNHSEKRDFTKTEEDSLRVEEVWFAGCHCDVGGGSVSNKTRHSLARIPLRWMIRECFKTNSGIMFNSESLVKIGLDPSTLYQDVAPRPDALTVGPSNLIRDPPATPIPINIRALSIKLEKQRNLLKDLGCEEDLGTEEEEELKDALSPNHDQLSIAKFWWILEILPFVHVRQHQGGNWVRNVMPHLAKPRHIPHRTPLRVHRSVSLRMKADFENGRFQKKGKKYIPKPHFDVEPTWID